jgi:hypothetical protein
MEDSEKNIFFLPVPDGIHYCLYMCQAQDTEDPGRKEPVLVVECKQ